MNRPRLSSYPNILPPAKSSADDRNLDGASSNAKLLLKLIQEYEEADFSASNENDQRLSGMLAILDDLKAKTQAARSSGKKSQAELRRCYTDLRGNNPATSHQEGPVLDEKEKLRRDLSMSFAAQKRLGVMCSSLGKEKQIMARELAVKAQELQELEELVNDLKVQNEKLREKVKYYALEHNRESCGKMEAPDNTTALQERNKELTVQLLRSLEGYKSLMRKLKDAQEDKISTKAKMEELRKEVTSGLSLTRDFKKRAVATQNNQQGEDIKEQIREIGSVFEHLAMKLQYQRREA